MLGLDPKVLCFQVLIVTVSCSNVPHLLMGNKSLAHVKHVSSLDDVSGQLGAGHISVHCTVNLNRAFSVSFRCQKQSSQNSTKLCLDFFILLYRVNYLSWSVVLP